MKKQNRTLIVVVSFAVIVLASILYQQDVFKNFGGSQAIEVSDTNAGALPEPTQELMGEATGDPLKVVAPEDSATEIAKIEEQKMFQLILTDLAMCFDLKDPLAGDLSPVTIESILSHSQADLGPATSQVDKWMNWHLRLKEGTERRLRMELNETDQGVFRVLKYYAVDKEGLPIPMELPPEKSDNPSDEVVNQMLKEGHVFFKEKAAMASFAGGEHIDFVEKNGVLSEFEFQKGERYYRCQNFKSRESCQCIR